MKILFCGVAPLSKALGASKVIIELAESLAEFGCKCTLIDAAELKSRLGPLALESSDYATSLRLYLKRHADEYDVVDYDHGHLPFSRHEFPARPLFVARSVLLAHHFGVIAIPRGKTLRARVGFLLKGRAELRRAKARLARAQVTVEQADLVNVPCDDDKAELMRAGIPETRVVVVPYGLTSDRRSLLEEISSDPPAGATIAFVGTWDYRKGAREFPDLVRAVVSHIPTARFLLLGTARPEREVKCRFGSCAVQVQVVEQFRPEELPSLLKGCALGVFPSYIEGFPFGLLEMLAASLPVLAYRAPGATMMLPEDWMAERGDFLDLCRKAVHLLHNAASLKSARLEARAISRRFDWQRSAETTAQIYRERLILKNSGAFKQDGSLFSPRH